MGRARQRINGAADAASLAAAVLDHEAMRVVHHVLFRRLEERVQATLERTLELAIDKLQLTEKPGRMCGQFDAARRVALAELFNRIRRYE
jgi:hypothetical protein